VPAYHNPEPITLSPAHTTNKTPEFQDYDEDDSSNSNNTSFDEIGE